MNIPGYKRHDTCPRTPGCMAKRIFESESNGELYAMLSKDFVIHVCKVRGSEKPQVAYLGEWFNKRTQRTRWIGPARLEESVKTAPKDSLTSEDDWEFKGTKITKLDWMDT